MSDLISRQTAIDAIEELRWERFTRGDYFQVFAVDALEEAALIIERLPSAQQEIIRCKDCEHFHYDMPYVIQGLPVIGHEVCDFWGGGCKTDEDGFCSYAERRTDG